MIDRKVLPIILGVLILISISAPAAVTTNSTSFSTGQISQAAGTVKNYVETKYGLPSTISIAGKQVTNYQFLYLLTSATTNVANNKAKDLVELKNVSKPTSSSETLSKGIIKKSEYLAIASSINTHITKYGKVPNYVTTSKGKLKYQSIIYMYSKIMAYYNVKKVLPPSVSVNSWYAQTIGPPAKINSTTILKAKSTVLGKNAYGKVLRLGPFGTGTNKVAIIVGVHPQEVQTHIAMFNAIGALAGKLNNVKIYVYDVVVYNGADYSTGRAHGQDLAKKYVVPNIGTSFKLVMDTHGNTGRGAELYSGYPNFIFAPVENTKSLNYANKIVKSDLAQGELLYRYVSGTSPKYVTIPIANKGIPTIVYEQYINQANYAHVLYQHAVQVIKVINVIFA
ncbi:MAG: pseudomurein-binding repeat-containing protein [Methanobacterium sp.]|nr:pseudomurein-binding repeat-containing protein [Methanobacterium sp.]